MTAAAAPAPRVRRNVCTYPALPEIKFAFVFTIISLSYGWYNVYRVSQDYKWKIGDLAMLNDLPVVGERYKDVSNWEWFRWSPYAFSFLPAYIGHTLLFNIGSALLPETAFVLVYTLSAIASCIYFFSLNLVLLSIIQGTVIFAASYIYPSKWTVWCSCVPIMYCVMHETQTLHDDLFFVLLFGAYTLLSYISFCIDTVDGHGRPEDSSLPRRYLRMLFYAFYHPYLVSIIVLYRDFEKQVAERTTKPRNLRSNLFYGLRVAFWWGLTELILHFCYFETVLKDTQLIKTMDKTTFVSLGMALGQFFHMKYVVIFGLPTFFALLDNMKPNEGPMCLARVCLYSKVWRQFDRGLYQFFKTYIFVPICQPSFSLPRKVFGVFVSYGFVLLWHGFYHHNIVWICLNIIALFIEMGSKAFYSVESVRLWREKHMSDLTLRRILGWIQIIPFAFGLYSNFYFLGGSTVGGVYVDRVLIEETIPCRPFFLALITVGYFYTQCCMEIDRFYEAKEEKSKLKQKAQ